MILEPNRSEVSREFIAAFFWLPMSLIRKGHAISSVIERGKLPVDVEAVIVAKIQAIQIKELMDHGFGTPWKGRVDYRGEQGDRT
ncbi:hypothetical protein H0178_52270 [Cytobacillus firmus]|nr:hypothetical protein [Cytobacillus firmus]